MKNKIIAAAIATTLGIAACISASANTTHTVVSGDTMWKISVRYETGLSEIINTNPQIENPALIYPGQIITIPGKDAQVEEYEKKVVELVNEIRTENGLPKLAHDWELSRVARYKSQDMKDNKYFSHTSPVYGSPFDMIKNFGISYRSAGENIARGYSTPEAVVNGWMNSSGHRANILNSSYTRIGIGYVKSGNYWTQMFIRQ